LRIAEKHQEPVDMFVMTTPSAASDLFQRGRHRY
jgi:hypothetical protein